MAASESLIDAARAGDGEAIAALLRQSQPDMRRYARRVCLASDADDAVQDALLQLYRRIGTLRATAAFSSWIFEIIRRRCVALARKIWRLDPIEAAGDRATRSDADLGIDLSAAIQSLPEHYRSIVILRDIEERTIGEIAEALDLTRESTKARLHRARRLLREYLAGD